MVFGGLLLSTTQPKEKEKEETGFNLEQIEEEPSSMIYVLCNKSHLWSTKVVC